WKQVSADIDAARGAAALAVAQQAFDKGDLNAAGSAAAEASALLKDSPELAKLIAAIKDKEGAKKQRARTLAEAENLLAGGDWAKAQELLIKLESESPGEPEVAKASARAQAMQESAESIGKAVREQLANADQAMTRKDFDSALLAYTAAKQL